jgi:hypothetical protein
MFPSAAVGKGYHCSALVLAQNERSLEPAFTLQPAFADINIAKGSSVRSSIEREAMKKKSLRVPLMMLLC